MLSKYNLKVGFLYGSGESDFAKHETQFHEVINAAARQNHSILTVIPQRIISPWTKNQN